MRFWKWFWGDCGRSVNVAIGDQRMSRLSGVGFFLNFNG